MKLIKGDKRGAVSELMGEIFVLFILDVLGAYLITPLSTAIVGAQANVSNSGASAMLGLVIMMFAIVLVVINVVVVMAAVKHTGRKN